MSLSGDKEEKAKNNLLHNSLSAASRVDAIYWSLIYALCLSWERNRGEKGGGGGYAPICTALYFFPSWQQYSFVAAVRFLPDSLQSPCSL